MRDNERNVGRADHNPEGARRIAEGDPTPQDESRVDSADRHGHGAHGRGRNEERTDSSPPVTPGTSEGADRGTTGGSSEGAGGSVVDTRPTR